MIEYRLLTLEECKNANNIDASEYIENAWRKVNGQLQLVPIKWEQVGWPDGEERITTELEKTINSGGRVFGAFHQEDGLVAISSINHDFFGKSAKHLLLDTMFVSKPYRGQGIARKLFELCTRQAHEWGADKVYLCGASSENTIKFYKSVGCVDAQEINQEFYAQDERDIQMEFDLSTYK